MRLNVALAAHPERLQALLNAYLHGPGRHLFSPASADQADAMIACDLVVGASSIYAGSWLEGACPARPRRQPPRGPRQRH